MGERQGGETVVAGVIFLVVVGWGLGWLVARSLVAEPVRRVAAELVSALEDRSSLRGFDYAILTVSYYAMRGLSGAIHCAACSGFWIGVLLGSFGHELGIDSPLSPIGSGVAVMGANALLDGVLEACLTIAYGETHEVDHG
jgi:hypothetical protein